MRSVDEGPHAPGHAPAGLRESGREAERVPFARHAKRMFRYFVIYHKRLGESQRAYEARRRSGKFDYDSDEQEFISGIDEHLTRATDDLHKVTEYLLTNPSQ